MKKILSILGIGIFVTGTSVGSYPFLNLVDLNLKDIETVKILKVNQIKLDLQNQLNKTFTSEEEVVNQIKSNSITGLEFSAEMKANNDGLYFGLRTFNIIIKITDSKLFQWENNNKLDILLTLTAFIDERSEISNNLVQNELNSFYENKFFESSNKAKKEILKNNKIVEGTNIIYVEKDETIKEEDNKVYQQKYAVDIAIEDQYKWNTNINSKNDFFIKTNIDERKKIDFYLIKNEIDEKLNFNQKYYESIIQAKEELSKINFSFKNEVELTNIKIKTRQSKINTTKITFSYDLKLKNAKEFKWVDDTTDDQNLEVSVEIDNRDKVIYDSIKNDLLAYTKSETFKSVDEAIKFVENYKNLDPEISFASVKSNSTTTFGDAEINVELKITDINKTKWSDGTIENKTFTLKAQVDGRKKISFENIKLNILDYVKDKTFNSVDEAIKFVENYKNLDPEISFASVNSNSTTTFGDAEIKVELKITDINKAKWSDETIENKTFTLKAQIDGRISLSNVLTNKDLGYFAWNNDNAQETIKQKIKEKNNVVKINEIVIEEISNNSAKVSVIKNSSIYFAESIWVIFERDVRVNLTEHIQKNDIGSLATSKEKVNDDLLKVLKTKNPSLNINEVQITDINRSDDKNPTFDLNVKKGSKVYFENKITIKFSLIRAALALLEDRTGKIMSEKVETLEEAYNYFKNSNDQYFNKAYNWDEVKITNWTYKSEGSDYILGGYKIEAKSDSYIYNTKNTSYFSVKRRK